jgi:hypothetical protein
MRNSISIIVIVFSNCFGLFAQVNLDSLRTVWNDTNQPDTIRLQALKDIS